MAEDERRTENFENHNNEELRFTYRLDTWKKLISGVFIVIGISFSWVGSSQFTENTYTKSFNAPAFMMWFSTSWMALSYLPVVIFSLLMKKSIKETYRLVLLLYASTYAICCNVVQLRRYLIRVPALRRHLGRKC